jgi:26S proteasome regulatory subunit T1
MGIKESETGLAPPNLWDIPGDKVRMGEHQPLQVQHIYLMIKGCEMYKDYSSKRW